MAVIDLWHKRGDVTLCPLCGQRAGPPSSRHGRGLRWRVSVPGHPSESYSEKGRAQRREVALWAAPRVRASGETVDDMVALWRAAKSGRAQKTRESARDAAQVVLARWAGTKLAEVDHDDVQVWIAGLQAAHGRQLVPASASLRHKALQCLSGSLAIAVRRGLLLANPCDDVQVPKILQREGRFLSVDELAALARAADERHAAQGLRRQSPGSMIWFMGTTGVRIGEACALDVGHVDVARRRARVVRGKGDKSRNVPLTGFVLEMLDLERPRSEPLFVAPRTGGRVEADSWRRRWFDAAVEAAGLGDVKPHDLRHTAVSLAIHNGASIYDVQEMCGHSRVSTTLNIYGHLLDGHLDDVAARLDRALGTLPGKDRQQSA